MSKVGQTLIIIDGNKCIRAGRTFVVGNEWAWENDLPMLICCAQLSGIYIYKEIPVESFTYCISRLRCGYNDIQTKGDMRVGVFMNLEGVWFDKEQVIDFKNYTLDIEYLKTKWKDYWGNK